MRDKIVCETNFRKWENPDGNLKTLTLSIIDTIAGTWDLNKSPH